MKDVKNRHPSGRPIRKAEVKGRPVWRIPDESYNAPKLKVKMAPSAIGFLHKFPSEDDETE